MHTLHVVSHTHWDREWYQTFQQFRLRLVHLVDRLLDILKTTPDYRFFMLDGQTIVLEDYLQLRPERESELREHIHSGRILIGPWYILPDEFLVSPEATLRNLLEGSRIAKRYGPKLQVGYIPDTFGHIGQMPQILLGFGIDTACVWRGIKDEPCEVLWQSADGSTVLTANLRDSYSNAAGIMEGRVEYFVDQAVLLRDALASHAASQHLLLMNGTDHMEPSPGIPAAIEYASGKLNGDAIIHSTLADYIQAISSSVEFSRLPVLHGELRSSMRAPLLPGVLSTRMWVKQRNRACETLLEKWAEPFSTWASLFVTEKSIPGAIRNPAGILREAWRTLMQCHPHDSICGCSIDQVHEEMRPRFDQVEQIGDEITRQSLEILSECVDTQPAPALETNGKPCVSAVVVFNPTTQTRTDVVSSRVDNLPRVKDFELVDESGQRIPFQLEGIGNQALAHYVMSPKEMRNGLAMISDGTVMGMKIREMEIKRDNNAAHITIVLSEKGEANKAAWEQGRKDTEDLLADPGITSYTVLARSQETAQVVFSAAQVPGHGYRTFWVRPKESGSSQPTRVNRLAGMLMPLVARLVENPTGQRLINRMMPDEANRPPFKIENEFFVVEALPNGTLDVFEKVSGLTYHGQNRLVDGGDRGDEYNYSAPDNDGVIQARMTGARVTKGPVQQVIAISLALEVAEELAADRKTRGKKTVLLEVTSRITLTVGVPRVDILTEVDNCARDHRLRVHFTAPFATRQGLFDGHFEIVRRPIDLPEFDSSWVEQPRPEAPQRAFTAVTDGSNGLMVANRGLPEAEVLKLADGNVEIAVTLLRCVGWLSRDDFPERQGHAGPYMETPGAQMAGKWSFAYSIIPFQAPDASTAWEKAYSFEAPLRAYGSGPHSGKLPPTGSFLQSEPAEFTISSVKTTEDGRGWLVRGYNQSDHDLLVTLRTLLPYSSVEIVNLAEESLGQISLENRSEISQVVKGHRLLSLVFQ